MNRVGDGERVGVLGLVSWDSQDLSRARKRVRALIIMPSMSPDCTRARGTCVAKITANDSAMRPPTYAVWEPGVSRVSRNSRTDDEGKATAFEKMSFSRWAAQPHFHAPPVALVSRLSFSQPSSNSAFCWLSADIAARAGPGSNFVDLRHRGKFGASTAQR